MNVIYHPDYNIDLGLLNLLHPFDGKKFEKVHAEIKDLPGIEVKQPGEPISQATIDSFVGDLMRRLLSSKRYVLAALEVPYIPLLPFSFIDERILTPMRWGVSGTLEAARLALSRRNCWNLAGGYHHASAKSAEGFCIYNDIGITLQELWAKQELGASEAILIIDVDAHHGNGNAHVFMDNGNVFLMDMYNDDLYPRSPFTKQRVDLRIPLRSGVSGDEYLTKLRGALKGLTGNHRLGFVIAGTDVLTTDRLGGLDLSIEECVMRDQLIVDRLASLSVPAVFLGGGGYSKDSAVAIASSITNLSKLRR